MKKQIFILILIGILSIFMIACQSDKESDSDFEIFDLNFDFEIPSEDMLKEFSHTPTGAVYVETPDQPPVKIDFSCNEDLKFQTSDKHFILLIDNKPWINIPFYSSDDRFGYDNLNGHSADTVRTIGRLMAVYNGFTQRYPYFVMGYSNYSDPPREGDYIYPTIEYLLAQACFQDDCSAQTRKAVLKMAVEKQTYKFGENQITFNARKTGMFLMAVIMAKEKYLPFIEAIHADSDLQDAVQMNVGEILTRIDREISDLVSQYAIEFLSN